MYLLIDLDSLKTTNQSMKLTIWNRLCPALLERSRIWVKIIKMESSQSQTWIQKKIWLSTTIQSIGITTWGKNSLLKQEISGETKEDIIMDEFSNQIIPILQKRNSLYEDWKRNLRQLSINLEKLLHQKCQKKFSEKNWDVQERKLHKAHFNYIVLHVSLDTVLPSLYTKTREVSFIPHLKWIIPPNRIFLMKRCLIWTEDYWLNRLTQFPFNTS